MKNEFFNQTFEITFIISLLGFIFASMKYGNPDNVIPIQIIFLVLVIGIIHLITIYLVYFFSRGYGFQPNFVDLLINWSQITLLCLIFSFIHLMFLLFSWIYLYHDIFSLFFPLIPVIILGIIIILMCISLEKGSKLKLLVIPEKIKIFSEYDDNEILNIIIKNNSKKDQKVILEISIPNLIICDFNDLLFENFLTDEIAIPQKGSRTIRLQLKHNNPLYDNEYLNIKISNKSGYIEQKVLLKIQ